MTRAAWLMTVLVVVGGTATLAVATDGFRAFTTEGARRLDVTRSPRAVVDARMVDHLGRPFGWDDLAGHAVLVEFIFTTCPDLCQQMSTEFGALARADRGAGGEPTSFLSITFDPERDTVDQLAAVADHYGADGERWRFARIADPFELAATLERFGVVVVPSKVRRFEHNAAVHGVDPRGRLARIFDIAEAEEMLRWARQRSTGG